VTGAVIGGTDTATLANITNSASTVLLYESPGQQPGQTISEPLSRDAWSTYPERNNGDVTDPTETNTEAGIGANSAWQVPVAADRHNNYTLNTSNNTLVGSANFILADGHAKFLKVCPENNGVGGAVSVGNVDGSSGATCVSPNNFGGTNFVATFCRQ
jgi:hypothetical protein